jgi:predicted permease
MTAQLLAYLRGVFRFRRVRPEVDDELRFHVDRQTESYVARGLSPDDARRAALADLGGMTQAAEAVREVRLLRLEPLWQDARYALRLLTRDRRFALLAVFTLGLGVAANTAMFSIMDALILRTLPVPQADRLVHITPGPDIAAWSYPQWAELRDRQESLAGVFAWGTRGVDPARGPRLALSRGGAADLVNGLWVSGSFFDVLGVSPARGRLITQRDDARGGGPDGPVAVISDALWQRRFGADPNVIGRSLSIERATFTIVGITPPGFTGPSAGAAFDVAIPLGTLPLVFGRDRLVESTWTWLSVMGRLKAGQRRETATAELARLQPLIQDATRPPSLGREQAAAYFKGPIGVSPSPGGPSPLRETYRRSLIALSALVGLVLLIACVNLATLLLVRADARHREISLRMAIGASRGRLMRQFLLESLVLSAISAAVGLVLANPLSRWLVAQLAMSGGPPVLDLPLDGRVLAFVVALSVAVALLSGLFPALRATTVDPIHGIKGRGGSTGGPARFANRFIALQVALCVVLLVMAGLFVGTFASLLRRDPGFQSDRVLVVNVETRFSAQRRAGNGLALYSRMVEALRELPGVAEVSFSSNTPVSDNNWDTVIENPPGRSWPQIDRRVYKNIVSPRWFATYGIPFVEGRDFAPPDMVAGPASAIVNEAFARRYFPAGAAIGQTIRESAESNGSDPSPPLTIVGVVADSVYASLREIAPPTMYVPADGGSGMLSVRATGGAPGGMIPGVLRALAAVDRDVSVTSHSLADDLRTFTARERLLAWLSGALGLLALVLAGLGVYGVVAYSVGRRRREIGIRMALGANPSGVAGLLVRQVAVPVGGGIAAGVLVSLAAGQLVSALLFGVAPRDPATLLSAVLLLLGVAALASWGPVRRAAGVNPATTLRAD